MLKTRSDLPKHCSWNTDQRGNRFVRFRKNGFSTYIPGTPWGETFMRAYAAALDGVKEQAANIGASRIIPGSINALVVSYYRSPEFRGLKPSTQAARHCMIERFRNEHGDKPVARLTRQHVKDIIGAKADMPEAANNLLKSLRGLLSYAVSIDMIRHSPASDVKKYRSRSDGFHTWSESEIARFQELHPIGTRAGLALALLLYTAQRRGDVIRMGWQHVRGDLLCVRQQKTGTALSIPMHPELMRALALVPRTNLTFLMTERGRPFAGGGFSNWFRRQCNAAGLPQCSAHGLRKAAATRLGDAGCSAHQIMAITGHKSLSEVARYTEAADQARLARQALQAQLGAEREQNCPALPTLLDKTASK
jgi:integrase